jgi:hypothetical protein
MTTISLIAGQVQPTRMRWRRDDQVASASKSNSSPFETRRGASVDRRHRNVAVAVDRRGRRQVAASTPRPMEAKFVAQVIAQAYGLNQNPTAAQSYARSAQAEDPTHQVAVI